MKIAYLDEWSAKAYETYAFLASSISIVNLVNEKNIECLKNDLLTLDRSRRD